MKTWTFLTDLHGDEQDKDVVDAALDFVGAFKPNVRIFGGDLFDFRCLRKGADEDDRAASLERDFQMGIEFLLRYRPHIILLGNHDIRLWRLRESKQAAVAFAAMRGIEQVEEIARKIKSRILPYNIRDGIYQLGPISFIHGFEHSDAGRKREATAYGTRFVVQGHCHTEDIIPANGSRLYCVGALTTLIMPWNEHRTHVRRHTNGWAAGVADDSANGGAVIAHSAKIGNKYVCPKL